MHQWPKVVSAACRPAGMEQRCARCGAVRRWHRNHQMERWFYVHRVEGSTIEAKHVPACAPVAKKNERSNMGTETSRPVLQRLGFLPARTGADGKRTKAITFEAASDVGYVDTKAPAPRSRRRRAAAKPIDLADPEERADLFEWIRGAQYARKRTDGIITSADAERVAFFRGLAHELRCLADQIDRGCLGHQDNNG